MRPLMTTSLQEDLIRTKTCQRQSDKRHDGIPAYQHREGRPACGSAALCMHALSKR